MPHRDDPYRRGRYHDIERDDYDEGERRAPHGHYVPGHDDGYRGEREMGGRYHDEDPDDRYGNEARWRDDGRRGERWREAMPGRDPEWGPPPGRRFGGFPHGPDEGLPPPGEEFRSGRPPFGPREEFHSRGPGPWRGGNHDRRGRDRPPGPGGEFGPGAPGRFHGEEPFRGAGPGGPRGPVPGPREPRPEGRRLAGGGSEATRYGGYGSDDDRRRERAQPHRPAGYREDEFRRDEAARRADDARRDDQRREAEDRPAVGRSVQPPRRPTAGRGERLSRDMRNAMAGYSGPAGGETQDEYGMYGMTEGEAGPGKGTHFDPDYEAWREEQIRSFDNDYEAWRKERYQKFSEEFNRWRSSRTHTGRDLNSGSGQSTVGIDTSMSGPGATGSGDAGASAESSSAWSTGSSPSERIAAGPVTAGASGAAASGPGAPDHDPDSPATGKR